MKELIGFGLLILIIAASGCINNSNDPTKDIYFVNDPTVGENGPAGEYYINVNIRSKSNTAYSNITVELTGYSADNQTLGSKNVTIGYLKAGYGESAIGIITSDVPVDHATARVISATPE